MGLAVGVATCAPQLWHVLAVYGRAGIVLWLAAGLETALYLFFARGAVEVLGSKAGAAAIPFLWTGWEYFWCELNPLRFSRFPACQAFSEVAAAVHLETFGVYGVAFSLMVIIAAVSLLPRRVGVPAGATVLGVLAILTNTRLPSDRVASASIGGPSVAAIQLERPSEAEIVRALDSEIVAHPEADILVLSEYSFWGEPPRRVRDWCRANRRHVIAGGTWTPRQGESGFRSTAYVVGPDGNVVFSQGKSAPAPFLDDGLTACERGIWESPWGEIGICMGFDLHCRRVTDDLISQGAGAIVCLVMDRISWNRQRHEMSAKVGLLRAAEYRVGVLRACSLGMSQLVAPDGRMVASAPSPGPGERLAGRLPVMAASRMPLDHRLAPACSAITAVLVGAMLWLAPGRRLARVVYQPGSSHRPEKRTAERLLAGHGPIVKG